MENMIETVIQENMNMKIKVIRNKPRINKKFIKALLNKRSK